MSKIILMGLDYCPYTRMAQELLEQYNLKYCLKTITMNTKQEYKDKYKVEIFPLIFYGKCKIGGFDDLEYLIDLCNDIIETEIPINLILNFTKDLKH